MLKIVFSASPLDITSRKLITVPEAVFRAHYESNWICGGLFPDIIKDVDKSTVITDGVILHDYLGIHYSPDRLAGGTQMLMLIYYKRDMDVVWDLTACGDNTAKWLPGVITDFDVVCRLGYPMNIIPTKDWPVLCLNNGMVMTNLEEYNKCCIPFLGEHNIAVDLH